MGQWPLKDRRSLGVAALVGGLVLWVLDQIDRASNMMTLWSTLKTAAQSYSTYLFLAIIIVVVVAGWDNFKAILEMFGSHQWRLKRRLRELGSLLPVGD